MEEVSTLVTRLAKSFDRHLFGDLRQRIAHHLAHVAPETWLAMELAFLVNEGGSRLGMPGWHACLEKKGVDVTLIPLTIKGQSGMPLPNLYLELKIVDTTYWRTAWEDVTSDLMGRGGKPRATFVICVVVNAGSQPWHERRASTVRKYQEFIRRLPNAIERFEPVEGRAPFLLAIPQPAHRVNWPHPVFEKWRESYVADVRVLWVQDA